MKAATTTLVLCVASLLGLGMVMLYSSSMADRSAHVLPMQILWGSMGLALGLVAARVDYRFWKKQIWVVLLVTVVLLLLVFVPHVGAKINGARRWIRIGGSGIRFEPSEAAKLALIIAVAWYADRYQRHLGTFWRGLFFPGLLIAGILGLIFIEPDRGTTILLALVAGAMFFVAGAHWKFIVPMLLVGVLAGAFSLRHDTMRNGRIDAWLHPEEHKMDVGYQTYQGILGLGSGGWTGLGLGNSRQKFGFLPEQTTDFILPIIGEELGLAATMSVVVAFVLVVVCGMYISARASDTFGMVMGFGITFLIGLQAFINIAVVTDTVPNKGMPLPFISKGGSDLLIMLIGVGLLLGIARRVKAVESGPATSLDPDGAANPQLSY
jgi:cell division protein FtsW